MSLKESKVDKIENYIDTEYSSGDSNRVKMKQHYQEENNNEIDELSKELSEMGCIVDSVKRPPNICIETCVHEDVADSDDEDKSKTVTDEHEEDAYSDEFEEENSESEEISVETGFKSVQSDNTREQPTNVGLKLTKSQSSMSMNRPSGSISGRSRYG